LLKFQLVIFFQINSLDSYISKPSGCEKSKVRNYGILFEKSTFSAVNRLENILKNHSAFKIELDK